MLRVASPSALVLALVVAFAPACSSSSAATPDGGSAGEDSGPAKGHKDAGHDTGLGKPKGGHDAEADAGTVCGEAYGFDSGVDAYVKHDASPEAAVDGAPSLDAAKVGDAKVHDAGDAGVDAPVLTCTEKCEAATPTAFIAFERYQVKECGCVADGACYAECHDSSSRAASSACGMCLAAQTGEGLASTCTLAAAADCSNDSACTAYQACAGACPM